MDNSAGRPENLSVCLANDPGSAELGSVRNLPAVVSMGHCPPISDRFARDDDDTLKVNKSLAGSQKGCSWKRGK
eukprot:11223561-Lingulodinium_polyedra.AAC.1